MTVKLKANVGSVPKGTCGRVIGVRSVEVGKSRRISAWVRFPGVTEDVLVDRELYEAVVHESTNDNRS